MVLDILKIITSNNKKKINLFKIKAISNKFKNFI